MRPLNIVRYPYVRKPRVCYQGSLAQLGERQTEVSSLAHNSAGPRFKPGKGQASFCGLNRER